MESNLNNVKVIDKNSEEILFTCNIKDLTKAYDYAKSCEEMGLDVKVTSPSIHETLGSSLGVSEEEMKVYEEDMDFENSHHNESDSCCFKKE